MVKINFPRYYRELSCFNLIQYGVNGRWLKTEMPFSNVGVSLAKKTKLEMYLTGTSCNPSSPNLYWRWISTIDIGLCLQSWYLHDG